MCIRKNDKRQRSYIVLVSVVRRLKGRFGEWGGCWEVSVVGEKRRKKPEGTLHAELLPSQILLF